MSQTMEVLGHTVEYDIAPDELVMDIIVLYRTTRPGENRSGVGMGITQHTDAVVRSGLMYQAGLLCDEMDMDD